MLIKSLLLSVAATLLILLFSLQFSCKQFKSCNENPGKKLFVFIGEKVEVKELDPMYFGFLAYGQFISKYKIIESICGKYTKDTISFISYDHYGLPGFANFTNSLLFLENRNDTFYQVMYTYYDVYKTKNGEWATPYNTLYYTYKNDSSMNPHRISFKDEVFYNVKGKPKKEIRNWYPEPYYRINNDWTKATALWGNYVPELVEMEKKGSLTSWGFYGNPDSLYEPNVKDIVLKDIGPPLPPVKFTKRDSLNFLANWQNFFEALKLNDADYLKSHSFSKVICSVCEEMYNYSFDNKTETVDSFIISSSKFLRQSSLWGDMENKKFVISVSNESNKNRDNDAFHGPDPFAVYEIAFHSKALIDSEEISQTHSFQFVKTGDKYTFYGMKSYQSHPKF